MARQHAERCRQDVARDTRRHHEELPGEQQAREGQERAGDAHGASMAAAEAVSSARRSA